MLTYALFIAVLVLVCTIPAAHALKLTTDNNGKYGKDYNLYVNATINGHKVKFLVDTGDQITCVDAKTIHDLHLSKLHQSKILKRMQMCAADGKCDWEKAIDVKMSIENSTTFHTQIQLNGKFSDNLLSIHDLIKAFS